MSENIAAILERNALKYGDATAVNHPDGQINLTWTMLNQQANSMARYLKDKGIKKGDKVALLIPNSPFFAISLFALFKLGAIAVPINIRLTHSEIRYILSDSDAAGFIWETLLKETAIKAAEGLNLSYSEESDTIKNHFPAYKNHNLESLVSSEEIAEILYTSGTTGKPKGVVLSHNALFAVASMFAYEMNISHSSRMLILMPLSHSAPLNLSLLGAVYAGAATILGDFTPQNLVRLAMEEKTTHFFGAPVAFLLAAQLPDLANYDLNSMQYWIYGGAPMSKDAVIAVQKSLPGQLVSVYGLTEAGPNGVALHPHEHEQWAGSIGRGGTVNTVLKVVDEAGIEVAPGETGEIILKSASLMNGYYKNPVATAEAIKDGWLWTGDIARIDEDGYLWIMDRKKNMIISGGVNIYPKEIEDVLLSHANIADVAVIGVPHPEWGETVKAFLVAKGRTPSIEEIQSFCGEHLAKFKIPKLVEFMEAIPRNASGKILKHVLQEQSAQIS